MKKFLILCITLAVCLSTVCSAAAVPLPPEKESGYWKQIRVDLLPEPTYSEPWSDGNALYTYEVANGSSVQHYSDAYGCSYQGSSAWTLPKDKYYPGDAVEITISAKIDSYVTAADNYYRYFENFFESTWLYYSNDSADDGNFEMAGISAGSDAYSFENENGEFQVSTDIKDGQTGVSSQTLTVYDTFPNHDSYTGEIIGIDVYTNSGYVRYIYQWTGEQVIILSGIIDGPDNNQLRPMPRIKTDVYVYYDKSKIPADWNSGTPDLTESAATDLNGAFSFNIPVPEKNGTVIGIIIKVTMRCILPQNKDAFFLADYQDTNALNEIYVSTLISVDLNDSQYKSADQIKISRAVQFHNIPLGFLTFDDKNAPEEMQTNLADTIRFLGYSYMYRLLWDALTVGGVIFEELPSLLPAAGSVPLRVDCNYIKRAAGDTDSSHYSSSDNAIRLKEQDCLFDDNSRFTVLHEFGHFFEAATNGGKARCGWGTKISAGDLNHGGYLNQDTADSFVEGFATWYACVCQIYRKEFNPYQTGSWNIKDPALWKAWADEEMSVASVFANAMYLYDDIKTFWQNILRPDRGNFYDYYNTMTGDLGADAKKIAKLNTYITEAGLYKMPFGNNQYDVGEPYRDTNNDGQWTSAGELYTDANGNAQYDYAEPFADSDGDGVFDSADEPFIDSNGDGQYDFGEAYTDLDGDSIYDFTETYTDVNSDGIWNPGEPYTDTNNNNVFDGSEIYGDLMFAVDAMSGSIDTSKTLQAFDMKNAVLGESAANNFPVRKSIYLQPNSFIYLTGESTGTLKVTIKPSGKDAYSYTAYPADNKIYIGLTNTPSEGTVEISVPGGETIYKGDIAALQGQLTKTIGQTSALDYAEIKLSDLAPAGTIAAPSGGNPDAADIFDPAAIDNSEAEAMAASFDPAADITSMAGLSISGTGGTVSFIEKYSALLTGIAVFFAFIIIIIAVRRRSASRKKQTVPVYQEQPAQPVYPSTVYKKTFCKNCGAKIKDGKHFCENCGQKID